MREAIRIEGFIDFNSAVDSLNSCVLESIRLQVKAALRKADLSEEDFATVCKVILPKPHHTGLEETKSLTIDDLSRIAVSLSCDLSFDLEMLLP